MPPDELEDLEDMIEEVLSLFEIRVAAAQVHMRLNTEHVYTSDITRACLWQVLRNFKLLKKEKAE